MWLVVGLGNPGKEYQHNRHNIGFMAVDHINETHNFSGWQKKFNGLFATGTLAGQKTILLKPQTFMNVSGQSVQAAAAFYKIYSANIIVLHDELDLEPGKIRIKQGGGDGGHNGLRSIDSVIGKAYWRVRLGIGHPGDKHLVHGHVLSDFTVDDEKWLAPLLTSVGNYADLLLTDRPNFMNKVALELQKE